MEERLKFIFGNVNDWLKFGEQKNAAIIIFNTTIIIGILTIFREVKSNEHDYIFLLQLNFVTNFASIIFALLSFFPVLKRRDSHHVNIDDEDNLLFYMDISKYCLDDYYDAFINRFGQPIQTDNIIYNRHLISQIINNSKIAKNKYFYFKWAGRITLFGFVITIITYFSIKFF